MSYYIKLAIPDGMSREAREQFSHLVTRVAQRFQFQGLDDWQVDVANSRVLGTESEFHDLTRHGELNKELRAYFASKENAAQFSVLLQQLVEDVKLSKPIRLAPRDWMKAWRKHYKTQLIREGGNKIAIVPAWKKVPKSGLAVRITPGQAFGTGTHATTQLCLRLFLKYGSDASQVLDFGAGTGVLAIAALKANRASGVAVESDAVALEQCRKNARLNRVAKLKFALRQPAGKFDLVFANVLAPVLLQHRTKLHGAVKKGGLIFLSGILATESKQFLECFTSKNFELVDFLNQGDWSAIALRKLH